jgi:heterodisulfide reductase subunit A2
MNGDVIVVGGGVAGMEAAGQLAKSGYMVTLLEKEEKTGGHLGSWYHLFPDRRDSAEVVNYLDDLISHENITLMNGTSVESIGKSRKKFTLKTSNGRELTASAIIVATGFDLFKSERKEEYGYGIYNNVITSADLEKMFRSGSLKMDNGEIPKRIGIVHCVGSRDEKSGNLYCSKLCCVTAVKQAIEIKEILPESKVYCYYMDIRMGGAHYEELYMQSQEKYSVNFIRGKVSEVGESIDKSLIVKVEDTLAGKPLKMGLDMLVLMAGMEMSEGGKQIAGMGGLNTGENRFFAAVDNHFGSNISNIEGIFYAGTCTAPMNITETISHARSSVTEVINYLNNDKG